MRHKDRKGESSVGDDAGAVIPLDEFGTSTLSTKVVYCMLWSRQIFTPSKTHLVSILVSRNAGLSLNDSNILKTATEYDAA